MCLSLSIYECVNAKQMASLFDIEKLDNVIDNVKIECENDVSSHDIYVYIEYS